jgi:hypothetical protein
MIVIEGGRDQDTLLKQLKGMQKYFKFDLEVIEDAKESEPAQKTEQGESEPGKKGRKKAV